MTASHLGLCGLLLGTALARGAAGEALLVLDDAEGAVGPWRNTQIVTDPVHSGQGALRWDVAAFPSLDSPRFLADWTAFDELRFWAYLPTPVDFSVPLVFVSEGGYYLADWRLDWQGWKEHRIPLSSARPAHAPAGWDTIVSFGFRPQGYGQGTVPSGLVLVLDDIALHSPQDLPATTLADWVARERRERMAKLKARGNPYHLSVLDGLATATAEPDLPATVRSPWAFSGLATQALSAAWAAGSDLSPRRGDPVLIARAAALIEFCLSRQKDGTWFYSRSWEQGGDPNSDRFALGPLMDAVYWLKRLPDTADRWQRWSAPLRALAEFQYTHWGRYRQMGFTKNEAWGSSAGTYPNQDVFHLVEMTLAHAFWGDAKYLESAQETLAALEAHRLPDGGLHYIGPETEIPCYHDLNVLWIARYLTLTGDERARRLLADTAPYCPLTYSSEGRPEYYTDCWWKHYWSDGAASSPEIVAGITGDPHNKWLAERILERRGPGDGYAAIYTGMFYRADVRAEPLPDAWLRLDRNIGGPRGRWGSWYVAGGPGGGARDTFVGAMVCQPERAEPLNGALLAANIEVALGGPGPRDRTHLYVSGPDDIVSSALGSEAAALGARYSPRRPYINATVGATVPPTPWRATQVWLLSRYGLVGVVELEAEEEQTVPYIGGELRLGPDQPVTRSEAGMAFHCGALAVTLLEHTFATVASGPARPGYAAQGPTRHTAVTLRTPGDTVTAGPGRPFRYAALIAPEGAPGLRQFTRLQKDGVWGFAARFGTAPYAVVFSPTGQGVRVGIPWPSPAAVVRPGHDTATVVQAHGGTLTLDVGPAVVLVEGTP